MHLIRSALTAVALFVWAGSASAQNGPEPWTTYPPWSGVQMAAFCLTKYDSKKILHKWMGPPSMCSAIIAKNPAFATISEHQAGRAAIAVECRNVSVLGFSVGSATAIELLSACLCHEPRAIKALIRDEAKVRRALREWGGCQ